MTTLTTGDIRRAFRKRGYNVSYNSVKNTIDVFFADRTIRAGLYRVVPAELFPQIEAKLREGHFLKEVTAHA